jgi:hypothetical protein
MGKETVRNAVNTTKMRNEKAGTADKAPSSKEKPSQIDLSEETQSP